MCVSCVPSVSGLVDYLQGYYRLPVVIQLAGMSICCSACSAASVIVATLRCADYTDCVLLNPHRDHSEISGPHREVHLGAPSDNAHVIMMSNLAVHIYTTPPEMFIHTSSVTFVCG